MNNENPKSSCICVFVLFFPPKPTPGNCSGTTKQHSHLQPTNPCHIILSSSFQSVQLCWEREVMAIPWSYVISCVPNTTRRCSRSRRLPRCMPKRKGSRVKFDALRDSDGKFVRWRWKKHRYTYVRIYISYYIIVICDVSNIVCWWLFVVRIAHRPGERWLNHNWCQFWVMGYKNASCVNLDDSRMIPKASLADPWELWSNLIMGFGWGYSVFCPAWWFLSLGILST